jgi:hypothetical protein
MRSAVNVASLFFKAAQAKSARSTIVAGNDGRRARTRAPGWRPFTEVISASGG